MENNNPDTFFITKIGGFDVKFEYRKEANIEVGQTLYGIIATSIYTYDGVYPITVEEILWDREEVVFEVEQPCQHVSCSFYEMETYVFETEEDAIEKHKTLDFGEGMFACSY